MFNHQHGNLAIDDLGFYAAHETQLDFMIVDLGVSRHVDVPQYQALNANRPRKGNPPEAKKGIFCKEGDVWSIGAIAYNLLMHDVSPTPLVERGVSFQVILQNLKKSKGISEAGKDFVLSCLRLSKEERIDSKDLLDHQWFAQRVKIPDCDHALFNHVVGKLQNHNSGHYYREMPFKRIANQFVACHTPRRILQDYRDLYAHFDDDFLGTLSYEEFCEVLEKYVPGQENLRQLFEYMDENKTGFIEFDEFLGQIIGYEDDYETHVLMEAFYTLDVDNDGLITPDDLAIRLDRDYDTCAQMIMQAVPPVVEEDIHGEFWQDKLREWWKIFILSNLCSIFSLK